MSNGIRFEDIVSTMEKNECIIPELIFDLLLDRHYLTDDLNFMSSLEFPEPEKLWRYKVRMMRKWFEELPSKIRWFVFPYYLVHKNDWENLNI